MIQEKLMTMNLPYFEGKSKTVRVFVPQHEEGEKLPVIYMTDGQNLFDFDPDKGQLGCWYAREAVRAERERSGRAAVIVGIHNDESPLERANDLTPIEIGALNYPDNMDEQARQMAAMLRPRGEIFADFVLHTVMPAVEAQFPVKTGRENTAFCGSSSGGLASLYFALAFPDKFCAAGVFSPVPPGLIYMPEDAAQWIRRHIQQRENLPYLYMYAGGADEMEKMFCAGLEQTCQLIGEYYPAELLNKVIMPEEHHHESAWEKVFKDFLHIFLSR